jgi:hypothetical protein
VITVPIFFANAAQLHSTVDTKDQVILNETTASAAREETITPMFE